jgi:hypothetical protein
MKYLEVRKVTTNLMGRLARSRKVGYELMVADSGDDRTKGMMKFWLLNPSLLDSTLPDDQTGEASLCDLFTGAGIASIDGALAEVRR